MKLFNTPSDPSPEDAGKFSTIPSLIAYTIFLNLAFFQPGLWPVSMLTAFVIGAKRANTNKFWLGAFCATLYLAFYTLVCIFALPYIHHYTYAMAKWQPVWGSAVLAMFASIYLLLQGNKKGWAQGKKISGHLVAWSIALGLSGYCWFASSNNEVVEWSMAEALSPRKMDKLPDSDMSNFRLLPQARAQDFLKNANGDRTLTVSMPHMSPCDSTGKQCWESAFHLKQREDGIWYNVFFDTIYDIAVVDPTEVNMHVAKASETGKYNGFFLYGPESWPVKAAFAMHNPLSEQEDTLYWKNDDGTMTMLIPYVSYRPTVTGAMIPYLAGVMSVNRFGIVNDMSPATAKAKYPGEPFYPTKLARKYSEIFAKWNGGIWGREVSKRDELRVSEPDDAGTKPHFNQAPYVEVYEEGYGWQEVIALEPNSQDGKKLEKLLFFDAATGDCKQYIVPSNQNINGPRQSMANSMQGNWEAQWALGLKVEPRPLIKDGRIYYAVGVLTTENGEHPYVHSIVIDGATMKPYPVLNHRELVDLINKLSKGIEVTPKLVPLSNLPAN